MQPASTRECSAMYISQQVPVRRFALTLMYN
jgi:hypothetical protein